MDSPRPSTSSSTFPSSEQDRPRSSLATRLQSLLNDDGTAGSGRSSFGDDASSSPPRFSTDLTSSNDMWRAQRVAGNNRSTSALSNVSKLLDSPRSTTSLPVLRWFGKPFYSSPVASSSSSPSSSCPPSPPSALREAFEDDARFSSPHVQRPPPVRLQSVLLGQRSVRRSPPFLESLARTALPTASVTKPPPVLRKASSHTIPHDSSYFSLDGIVRDATEPEAYIDITQSPPTRTSLDSLRYLRDRGIALDPSPDGIPANGHVRSFSTSSAGAGGPTRWWFGKERKADVDNLLDESDRRDSIQSEEAHIRKKYLAPKNPVVFCHGLLGFDSVTIGPAIAPVSVAHWRGIKDVLEARGIEVLITRVPATSSPIERAKVLEARVSEVYPGRAVHLIGHSMGGLDCRYLTTHLTHRKFRVLSITTVATPHRGSSFADHFIATVGKERLPQFVSLLDLLPNGGGDGKAFESLTLDAMRKFNEETPDVDGVRYFSWGAVFEPGLFDAFKWPHSVILEKEGPNDGLVSIASAKWGTYLGTLEDVNHLDLIGWMNTARYKWAEFTGREIKFKPATFYLGVADHIARDVEGQGREDDQEEESRKETGGSGSEDRDIEAAKRTRAGEGVHTLEGVEHQGPESPVSEGMRRRTPTPDGSKRAGPS